MSALSRRSGACAGRRHRRAPRELRAAGGARPPTERTRADPSGRPRAAQVQPRGRSAILLCPGARSRPTQHPCSGWRRRRGRRVDAVRRGRAKGGERTPHASPAFDHKRSFEVSHLALRIRHWRPRLNLAVPACVAALALDFPGRGQIRALSMHRASRSRESRSLCRMAIAPWPSSMRTTACGWAHTRATMAQCSAATSPVRRRHWPDPHC